MKKINHKSLAGVFVVSLFAFCTSMFLFPADLAAEEDYLWEFRIPFKLNHLMKEAQWISLCVIIKSGDEKVGAVCPGNMDIKDGSFDKMVTVRVYQKDLGKFPPGKVTDYEIFFNISNKQGGINPYQLEHEQDKLPIWAQAKPKAPYKTFITGNLNY